MKRSSIVCLLGMFSMCSAPALAALSFGSSLYNPDHYPAETEHFKLGAPAWAGNPVVATLTTPVSDMQGDFEGHVLTQVIRLDNGRLGFAYTFFVTSATDTQGGATFLDRASFSAADWANITILDVWSGQDGESTAASGSPNWEDGDPAYVSRALAANGGAPSIQWLDGSRGTMIGADQYSATIYFETDARSWMRSNVDLIDNGASGDAAILAPVLVPTPAAAGLCLIGLGLVGWTKRRLA